MKTFAAAVSGLLLIGAAPVNWVQTASTGANGAVVMGNPQAKVRLVEYLSYTCTHCAHFVSDSAAPLKTGYVARGEVALELRNAVRDQFDFTAALLARCGAPARTHGNSEAIFKAQPQWMGRIEAFAKTNGPRLSKRPVNQQLVAVAQGIGLTGLMKARGYTVPQLNACLTSKPAQDQVLAMTKEAWNDRKINGTPSFLVNGIAISGTSWAIVEPSIKAALAAH
ncbi:MAG: thioredoxin domain-containing protein [Sphingomonadales bacterium]|nr:thioredoxin domain-containing protein [Sphingomonadales bacterium]